MPESEEVKSETTEETPSTETPETEQQGEETPDETPEPDSTPDSEAVLNLLKDPKTRKMALMYLAEQEGLRVGEQQDEDDEPEPEPKDAQTKTLEDEIKEIMGDDLSQIPTKTWNAIDRLISRRMEGLESKFVSNEQRIIQQEATTATERLFTQYPDAKNYQNDIVRLMKTMRPAEGVSQYEFLKNVYHSAKSQKSVLSTEKERVKRITRNAKDVNLTSGNSFPSVRTGSKRVNINEAIEAAMAGRKLGD